MIERRPIKANGSGEPATLAQVQAEIEAALAAGELSLQEKFEWFERKLKAALTDSSATASELGKLLGQTDNAIAAAEQEALAARERGLDFVASPDAKLARECIENAEFAISRLLTQRPRLEALLQARLLAEQRDAYVVRYEQLKIEGAALGAELVEYPGLVGPLVDLFGRLRAFRERCRALHVTDPGGLPHVSDPELRARRLDGFTGDVPSLLDSVRLPDFTSGRELWPEKPTSFEANFAASMVPQHPGATWCDPEFLAARRRAITEEQEKLALHARARQKEQQDRENQELKSQWQRHHGQQGG